MKKLFSVLFLGIFLIAFSNAVVICIDHIPPSAPSNLILTNSGLNIQLKWTAATDEPSCSGISHYEIYRSFNDGNFSLVNNFTTTTNYSDSVFSYGKYSYIVHAVDIVGHNDGNGILNSMTISAGGNSGGSSGGGGGSSFQSIFKCGNWSRCIQNSNSSLRGTQTRICQDVRGIQTNKTESKSCIPNFVSNSQGNSNENSTGNQINLTNSSINKTRNSNAGFLTGAAIGAGDLLRSNKLAFLFIILIFLLAIWIILKKRKSKKKKSKKKK